MQSTYGRRLLTDIVDAKSRDHPDLVWTVLGTSQDMKQTREVTFYQLAQSVNYLAHDLERRLGKRERCALWYASAADIRIIIFILAATKIGHHALLMSPRITSVARRRLLEGASCNVVFGADDAISRSVSGSLSLEGYPIPSLEDCLNSEAAEKFPFHKQFSDLEQETAFIVHTSGSTNLPKPISITHGALAVADNFHHLPEIDGKASISDQFPAGARVFSAFPLFHAAGMNLAAYSFFYDFTLILPPTNMPPSLALAEAILNEKLADAGYMAPAILAELAQSPENIQKLGDWESVGFAGAPLDQDAGDAISEATYIYNVLGSTETSHLPEAGRKAPEDWMWHQFHPSLGIQFVQRDDGLYDIMFRRSKASEPFQVAFQVFPHLQEFSLADVYERHPTKDYFKIKGRSDDIITLSNGEKLQANEVEDLLTSQSTIKTALIVGEGQFQPALVLVPTEETFTPQCGPIGQALELANAELPDYAQIDEDHLIMLKPDHDLPTGGKGKVQRKAAQQALAEEIKHVYECESSNSRGSSGGALVDFKDTQSSQRLLRGLVEACCPKVGSLNEEANLFEHGMDSLQGQRLVRRLRSALAGGDQDSQVKIVNTRLVYNNPTLRKLSSAMMQLSNGKPAEATHVDDDDDDADAMKSMIDKYTKDCAESSPPYSLPHDSRGGHGVHVLLTGSTGSLGSYILSSLMASPLISSVTCLNRSSNARERQAKSAALKGLPSTHSSRKVTFLTFDISAPRLGLSESQYGDLTAKITHIVHNAWPVDFNQPLSYFGPHVAGCQHLALLASATRHHARLIFLSSVGAANNWLSTPASTPTSTRFSSPKSDTTSTPESKTDASPVPEEALTDLGTAEPLGYGRSKLVSEHILDRLSHQTSVPVTICRVGQIAGPVSRGEKGAWNRAEWLPSLVFSSAVLGMIPEELGGMDGCDWIPVDLLAEIMKELILDNHSREKEREEKEVFQDCNQGQVTYLHLVNPHPTPWSTLAPVIKACLGQNTRLVPLAEWIKALKRSGEVDSDDGSPSDASQTEGGEGPEDRNPALRLVDFFESLPHLQRPKFSTEEAQKISETLRGLKAVSPDWQELWMRQWGFAGRHSRNARKTRHVRFCSFTRGIHKLVVGIPQHIARLWRRTTQHGIC